VAGGWLISHLGFAAVFWAAAAAGLLAYACVRMSLRHREDEAEAGALSLE
jgi:predicted MFS family arabinose efflux permease